MNNYENGKMPSDDTADDVDTNTEVITDITGSGSITLPRLFLTRDD